MINKEWVMNGFLLIIIDIYWIESYCVWVNDMIVVYRC